MNGVKNWFKRHKFWGSVLVISIVGFMLDITTEWDAGVLYELLGACVLLWLLFGLFRKRSKV